MTIKLSKHLCLECSTCAIFLSSSFTVSIMALFLSKSLSETLIKAPFILLFSLVISCIPSTNSLWKRFLLMYPLSPTSLPYMKSTKALYSKGLRSSTSTGVIIKLRSSPFSLQIKCNLKPKNQSMEHFRLWDIPLKTLWICILWFLQTRSGVLSTKLMPVHFPNKTFLINKASGMTTSLSNSTIRLYETTLETNDADVYILFQDRNV